MKKKVLTLAFCVIMLLSVFPVSVFAAEQSATFTQNAIEDMLSEINAEYGTNIHILTANFEKKQYGASAPIIPTLTNSELENELRYIAKYEIPEYEHTTQEAIQAIAHINEQLSTNIATQSSVNALYNPVLAVKTIDYATAVAEAYITEDYYGNTVWGSIVGKDCITDKTQVRWFYTENPDVSRIDGGRTLYWVGEGDYCATIDGVEYFLSSGTQYAEMYIGNYCN